MANETLHDERLLTRAEILSTVERTRQARAAQIDASLRQSAERIQQGNRFGRWWNGLETVLRRPAVTSFKDG